MSDVLPSVTIIIPARPDQTEVKAVDAARRLRYPPDRLEIILARGKQPSVQRNAAIRAARGDLIYFLDDDSVPEPGNLEIALKHCSDASVKMVGGPNLCPAEAPPLEKVFAVVLASWLAFGPSRARYAPVGTVRSTGEKELILCNLLSRRDVLLELGGFDEALYPNEENALMDEIQRRGGKLVYDPGFVVHRRPRHSVKAFTRMLMTYGRGRAEQFRLHPTFGSALNFVPPLFCLYLALLLMLSVVPLDASLADWRAAAAVPLALYGAAVVAQTGVSAFRHGVVKSMAAMPLLVWSHLMYGVGFWRGLLTRVRSQSGEPAMPVSIESVAL